MEQARVLFARVRRGRPEKSLLLTGLRGVGKTVLLNAMCRVAEDEGYQTIFLEAHEDKSLPEILAPRLRALLYRLDRIEGAKEKIRRGLAVLKSFISSVKVTFEDLPVGLDIDPEIGSADSGDIEMDLPDLLSVCPAPSCRHETTASARIPRAQAAPVRNSARFLRWTPSISSPKAVSMLSTSFG